MIKIIYKPTGGTVFADGQVEREAAALIDLNDLKCDFQITTSTGLFIDAIRVLIAQGKLNYETVVFIFEEKELKPNKFGNLLEWPDGFCDKADELIFSIMDERENILKKNC